MNEKVAQALSHVDDTYVSKAAKRKKRKKLWIPAVAAVLALVFFWRTPTIPLVISAKAVSLAPESRVMERPDSGSEEFDEWFEQRQARKTLVDSSDGAIRGFAEDLSDLILSGKTENMVWSPVNAYIGLAMTAELTGSHTQAQLMELLGIRSMEDLRARISAVWETLYEDDGREVCTLANSLWLDEDFDYHQSVMDDLSYHYYASVYQGDLGSQEINRAITNWLNTNTGGFLKDMTGDVELDPSTSCMALVSTIYFQGQWNDKFDPEQNSQGFFYTPDERVLCEFMNVKEYEMNYYWGEDFSAVQIWLQNGASMWFFLPDEDKTVEDVLESGEYMSSMTSPNSKYMKVNLSIPKFDISAAVDLKEPMTELGLGQLFQVGGNDFSPSIDSDLPIFLDEVHQNTRVAIDEEGVTAASYILLEFGAGAAMPPDEIVDFILDRPFVFAITKENIPLFVGTVNDPTK